MAKITGQIINKRTRQPVPYATVSVIGVYGEDLGVSVAANSSGYFLIDSPYINDVNALQFTSSGYSPSVVDYLSDGDNITVELNENGQMQPVVITTTAVKKNATPLLLGLFLLMMLQKKKTVGATGGIDTKLLTWAIIAYFGINVGSKLLQKVGIFKSQADVNVEKEAVNPGSFWSPNFYKTLMQNNNVNLLTDAAVQQFISTIRDSFGFFTSDSNKAIGVFRQLNYQTQLSYLADKFQQQTGSDLLEYLRGQDGIVGWLWNKLSSEDIDQITQYISKLPQF